MTPGKFIFLHCKSHSNTRIYHLQHDPENQKIEEKKRKRSQKKHEKKNQNQNFKEFFDQIWFLYSWVQ
jgi:flagellar biogenesis protein FliO